MTAYEYSYKKGIKPILEKIDIDILITEISAAEELSNRMRVAEGRSERKFIIMDELSFETICSLTDTAVVANYGKVVGRLDVDDVLLKENDTQTKLFRTLIYKYANPLTGMAREILASNYFNHGPGRISCTHEFNKVGWIIHPVTNKTSGLSNIDDDDNSLTSYVKRIITVIKSWCKKYESMIEYNESKTNNDLGMTNDEFIDYKKDIYEFIKRRKEIYQNKKENKVNADNIKLKPRDNSGPKNITMYKVPSIVYNADQIKVASSYPVDENTTYSKFIRVPDTGIDDLSDGYHSFNDLYYQRAVLFAAIVNQNPDLSWKSFKHEDGKYCFDKNGEWFIVGVDTPEGPYTYHYEKKYWDMFKCKELECGRHWDGHTDKDVTRLLSLVSRVKKSELHGLRHMLTVDQRTYPNFFTDSKYYDDNDKSSKIKQTDLYSQNYCGDYTMDILVRSDKIVMHPEDTDTVTFIKDEPCEKEVKEDPEEKRKMDEYLEQEIFEMTNRADEFLSIQDILDRFIKISKEYPDEKWTLNQIFANLNILKSYRQTFVKND